MFHDGSAIVACANPTHINQAVALIRISGFSDLEFLKLFIKKDPAKLKPRYVYVVDFFFHQEFIDQVCLTYFKAPHSFTGENVLELGVHGNALNIERFLHLFSSLKDFRLAKPGEFAFRAFLNKKMTLSQVEGLDLFLNACSPMALKQGQSLMLGELNQRLENLLKLFLKHKSALEIYTDFADDVGDRESLGLLRSSFTDFFSHLRLLRDQIYSGSNLSSPKIVIFGAPNAGKSTFFNLLLNRDRAIISPIKGTTRDYISEPVKIGEVVYHLVDTAGIHHSEDEIESQGILKARELTQNAFFKILLINSSTDDASGLDEFLSLKPDLILFTHDDKAKSASYELILRSCSLVGAPVKQISFLSAPIEPLLNQVKSSISDKFDQISLKNPLLVDRQSRLISTAYGRSLEHQALIHETQPDLGILSASLEDIGHCLSELVGVVSPDTVLDNIFSNFCIGK